MSMESLTDTEVWDLLEQVEGGERIEVLMELAGRSFRVGEFGKAAELSGQAADEAGIFLSPAAVEECCYGQGRAFVMARDLDEAVAAFERGVQSYVELEPKGHLSRNLWGIADCQYAKGDYPAAQAAATRSVDAAVADEDWTQAGASQLLLARALYLGDREEDALTACSAARDFFRTVPDPAGVADVDDFTATVHHFLHQPAEAADLLDRCLLMMKTIGDERSVAYAKFRLAYGRGVLGDHEGALELLAEADTEYEGLGDLIDVARCRTAMARHHETIGRLGEALELARSASALWDGLGEDAEYLRNQAFVSRLYYGMHRYEDAIRVNDRIVRLAQHHDDAEMQSLGGWALLRMADDYLAMDEWDSVLEVLDQDGYWDGAPDLVGRLWKSTIAARALYALGREDEALAVAEAALAETDDDDVNSNTAYLYEIKARVGLRQERPDFERHIAHAIALHLAAGDDDRARDLADYFRPTFSHPPQGGVPEGADAKNLLQPPG
jgi:tetratricopeptide (TPR) repeat protein